MTNALTIENLIDHSLIPRFIFVTEDRYSGCYSDHVFTAWNYGIPIKDLKDPHLGWCYGEPIDASGSDYEANKFWKSVKANPEKWPFNDGGETIQQAALNFLKKDPIKVYIELFEGVIYRNIQGNNKLYTFKELGLE